jgi:D-arginine dehydrogenase
MADDSCDVLIIGAGIAGASLAANLRGEAGVRMLEMEDQPGYHSTGRSAALFSEAYGNATIRALTRASRSFFFSPPPDFGAVPLVKPRPVLIIGSSGQQAALESFLRHEHCDANFKAVSKTEALEVAPFLRSDNLIGGVLDLRTADIEVHELHLGFLKLFRQAGGIVSTGTRVIGLIRRRDEWLVQWAGGSIRTKVIVNAAGAWAGEVGRLAGAQEIGLEPCRRTAALVDTRQGIVPDHWPMIVDADEKFYSKPDAGRLLVSPADETPVPASDVQAEELDVAVAIDRLEQLTTLGVRRLHSKWAGLRSFVRDRSPVVGYDCVAPGFFWMAALGGYGIQTAPALGKVAADLLLDRPISRDIVQFGIGAEVLSAQRLR